MTVQSVNGQIEFRAAFEDACQSRGRRLFVLPPRSPMLRGQVTGEVPLRCKTLTIPVVVERWKRSPVSESSKRPSPVSLH